MRGEFIGGIVVIAAGIIGITTVVAYSASRDSDPLACRGENFASRVEVLGRDGPPPFRASEPIEIRYSYVN